MKYLPIALLLLAVPVQAADNTTLSTKACLQLIKDYWTGYEASGVEPAEIFDKFDAQCESTKELDKLILNNKDINDITARLVEKGIL